MNTPVLTKRQQKHSLSAKKTPVKGLRNVLAQPQDNYWPLVSGDKRTDLENLVKELTPIMKRPSLTIPWSKLRHMNKEERAKAKKAALSKETMPDKDILSSVITGMNALTRALDKNDVCCLLLDPNIEPAILIKHIILMAQNKKKPILLLPSLKKITLHTIGFATAALGLKNIVKESTNHHFHSLYISICDIFKDIPPPTNSLQLFQDIETMEETILSEDSDASVENQSPTTSPDPEEFTLSKNVYLYRSSIKERAFVLPGAAKSNTEKESTDKMECNDFISIGHYESDDEKPIKVKKNTRYINIHGDKDGKGQEGNNKHMNVKYLPLKVKRLQGNSNRVKATKAAKQKKK